MRLRGQAKGGYYAAHPDAIAAAMERVIPPEDGCFVFDPCAGEADAITQIADLLGGTAYGVELEETRSVTVRKLLGDRALAPADIFGTAISPKCWSLAWVNPPYDDQLGGGGRVEMNFVRQVYPQIAPDGVMCLVCTERVAQSGSTMSPLSEMFVDIQVMEFPPDCRPYNEVVVFCRKPEQPRELASYHAGYRLYETALSRYPDPYRLPPGKPPRRFRKTQMTDAEMARAVQQSALRKLFQPPPELPLPTPPIAPGEGHRAMLLAAGLIDGLICPEGEPPHVVRGTCRKKPYIAESTSTENTDGSVTTKTVTAEKIELRVRVLDSEGVIHDMLEE